MKRHVALIHLKAVNWKSHGAAPARRAALPRPLAVGASQVQTSLGTLPGAARHRQPALVPRAGASAGAGRRRRPSSSASRAQCGKAGGGSAAEVKLRPCHRTPTFFDQIATSLLTVLCGFGLATLDRHPVRGAARHEPGALSRRPTR